MPGSHGTSDDDLSNEAPGVKIARLGRISKPYDHARYFPETGKFYKDHICDGGVFLKIFRVHEDDWNMKLVKGTFYSNFCFGENTKMTETESEVGDDNIRH